MREGGLRGVSTNTTNSSLLKRLFSQIGRAPPTFIRKIRSQGKQQVGQ